MFAACEDSHTQKTPPSLLEENSCLFPQVDYPVVILFNIFNSTNNLGIQYTRKDMCCSSSALSSHLGKCYQCGHNLLKAHVDP